jgi:hypothetical protein
MSTTVVGIVPPDEQWTKMKGIWDACKEAEIDPPQEVKDYFDCEEPDPKGMEIPISCEKWGNDMSSGYEVTVSKIPKKVKIIRFYNSW